MGGQARALNGIGWFHAKLGDYQQALPRCQKALAMLRELDDTVGAAYTMNSVAYIHRQLGDRHQAIACYQQALELFEISANPKARGGAHPLGDIHDENGDVDAARARLAAGPEILSQLGHPDVEQVRAKLNGLAVTAR